MSAHRSEPCSQHPPRLQLELKYLLAKFESSGQQSQPMLAILPEEMRIREQKSEVRGQKTQPTRLAQQKTRNAATGSGYRIGRLYPVGNHACSCQKRCNATLSPRQIL